MTAIPLRPETICLITTGQPSTNPRLVKEADALVEAGYRVHVIGAWCADWATGFDQDLLAARSWPFAWVDWRRTTAPALFWRVRLRHRTANWALDLPGTRSFAWRAALSPITPELIRAAAGVRANLYVAHNLGALPAALAAAKRWKGAAGFDAEDLHSGQLSADRDGPRRGFVEDVERRLLPACSYVTAASPLIAQAYHRLTGVREPTCVLNVFPRHERPPVFRLPDDREPTRLYWFSQTIGRDRGLEDVVSAMGRLHEWPLELHLRGAWQAGYREALLALADRSGVPRDRVVAHEPAPPGDMVKLAAAYDIGLAVEQAVSVNNDIALSNKVFAYVLAGAAVVATRTRAQAAMALDLATAAVFYDPGDVAGLVAGLRGWLENRKALADARHLAWRLGDARFNWDLEKTKFLTVVRNALGHDRSDGGGDVPTPADGAPAAA